MGRIVYTDPSGQEFSVMLNAEAPVVTIGRATDCTIRSNRKSVSRHHAEFRFSNGRFEVVDLDSANGTYLIISNERRPVHGRQFISHGDEIWCGDFILHFYEEQTQVAAQSHFGAQSGRVSSGAQPAMSAGFGGGQGYAPDTKNYEYAEHEIGSEFGDFNANFDADSPSYGEYEEIPVNEISEVHEVSHNDLDRLRAEKRSIEELAAKQAFEVVELRIQLSEQEQIVEDLRQSISALEAAKQDHAGLKKESERAQELEKKLNDALSQVQQLEKISTQPSADPVELVELRQTVEEKEQSISSLQARLDEADSQLKVVSERAEKAEKSAADAHKELRHASANVGSEEVEGLRNELERQGRLMAEFERRSRELQLELDHERATATGLREKATSHESLVEQLAVITRERDDAIVNYSKLSDKVEHAETTAEEAKNTIRDLKGEIQGLKRLLQMERERGREDKALGEVNAGLLEQIATLKQEVEGLQGTLEQQASELQASQEALQIATLAADVPPAYFDDMREQIDTLERIVDAIERTDLQPLTTVDRIRLQSAIRDSAPRGILQEMRRMTIEIVAKDDNS